MMTERGQWPAKQVVDVRAYNKYDTSVMLHVVLLENFSLWKHIFDPSGRHHHATPWTEMSNHEPAARKSFCAVRFGNQSDFFFFLIISSRHERSPKETTTTNLPSETIETTFVDDADGQIASLVNAAEGQRRSWPFGEDVNPLWRLDSIARLGGTDGESWNGTWTRLSGRTYLMGLATSGAIAAAAGTAARRRFLLVVVAGLAHRQRLDIVSVKHLVIYISQTHEKKKKSPQAAGRTQNKSSPLVTVERHATKDMQLDVRIKRTRQLLDRYTPWVPPGQHAPSPAGPSYSVTAQPRRIVFIRLCWAERENIRKWGFIFLLKWV